MAKIMKTTKRWSGDQLITETVMIDDMPVVQPQVQAVPVAAPVAPVVAPPKANPTGRKLYDEDELKGKNKEEIIDLCESLRITATGSKADMIKRILGSQK